MNTSIQNTICLSLEAHGILKQHVFLSCDLENNPSETEILNEKSAVEQSALGKNREQFQLSRLQGMSKNVRMEIAIYYIIYNVRYIGMHVYMMHAGTIQLSLHIREPLVPQPLRDQNLKMLVSYIKWSVLA